MVKKEDKVIVRSWSTNTSLLDPPFALIGISGKKRSGKTMVANMFKTMFSSTIKVTIMSLAEPLKQECKKKYKLTDAQVYGKDKEKVFKKVVIINRQKCDTARKVMQVYGQWKRELDKNYWVEKLIKKVDAFRRLNLADMVIIDDVRFINEVNIISQNYGVLLRVQRVMETYEKIFVSEDQDFSETALDHYHQFDFHFINQGLTLEEAYKAFEHTVMARDYKGIYKDAKEGFNFE